MLETVALAKLPEIADGSRAARLAAGRVDVKVVSFSETSSAEKYVVPLQRRGKRG